MPTTLAISFAPEETGAIQARALAEGISAEQHARRVVEDNLKTAPERAGCGAPEAEPRGEAESRPIWEVLAYSMVDLPPEDLASIPPDGASQVDRYIYGHSKR